MLCVLMTHPVFDQIENQSECVLLTQLFNLNSFGGIFKLVNSVPSSCEATETAPLVVSE